MKDLTKQQIYGYGAEPVEISDVLSYVESRNEAYGNKPNVKIFMYGDAGKWRVDAGVHFIGHNGRDEYQPFLLKAYKQYGRAENYAKALAEEHDFSFEGLKPELTNESMLLQYQKRKFGKDAFTDSLENEMAKHGTELMQTIEQYAVGDENEKAFLSKQEFEQMLNNHFMRIEDSMASLLKSNESQQNKNSFSDYLIEMKKQLKDHSQHFKGSVIERTVAAKQKMNDNVNGLLNNVRDSITDVKESAKNTVKQTILSMNERLKDFSTAIDQKLHEHEPVQLDRKSNKAMAAQELER
ncbi:hypothetical protein [Lysinibacillus sp. RC79]|uniref:hypothetical protein n=1 Tax=Lysinibacillus sp. RC79 TaxID=3156296 RepID=UPI0035130028